VGALASNRHVDGRGLGAISPHDASTSMPTIRAGLAQPACAGPRSRLQPRRPSRPVFLVTPGCRPGCAGACWWRPIGRRPGEVPLAKELAAGGGHRRHRACPQRRRAWAGHARRGWPTVRGPTWRTGVGLMLVTGVAGMGSRTRLVSSAAESADVFVAYRDRVFRCATRGFLCSRWPTPWRDDSTSPTHGKWIPGKRSKTARRYVDDGPGQALLPRAGQGGRLRGRGDRRGSLHVFSARRRLAWHWLRTAVGHRSPSRSRDPSLGGLRDPRPSSSSWCVSPLCARAAGNLATVDDPHRPPEAKPGTGCPDPRVRRPEWSSSRP
jgi:hypothetical protein